MNVEQSKRSEQLQTAIARWDTEGGAGPNGPQDHSNAPPKASEKSQPNPSKQ